MPSATQDSIIRDIDGLIDADDRNPDMQPELARERQELVASVSDIKTLKARQQELGALRQEVTQQLDAAFLRGRDAAITYRSAVRSKLGPRNERLVHYKIAPLRKRSRKPKVVFVKETGGEAVASPPTQPAN